MADLDPAAFRAALHRAADLTADYLETVGARRVRPSVAPGDVARSLLPEPPEEPVPLAELLDDYERLIEPHVTHWNHPRFFAYFSITGSRPGVLAELLAAGLNVNAMLWRTSPAATELEERACDWLRQLMALPPVFRGHINDTASISTFVALAAARHRATAGGVRERGLSGAPPLVVYASDQAHSSVDKAVIALGLGCEHLRRLPVDESFRLRPDALAAAIAADRAAGRLPMAVVATAGTTSTTSVDPLRAVAETARREGIWLHTDAAYAGAAAICPEFRPLFDGLEEADSIVTNPHKWLFVPVDCSVLFVRDVEALRAAFALVPDYLRTSEEGVTNLMDLGLQLGRRFRALKLWMVIAAFGAEGLRSCIREHCRLARDLARWIAADPGFTVVAPVPFSTVCFRARRDDDFNERLLRAVNDTGFALLSATRLGDRSVLRLAIGNLRTTEDDVRRTWELVRRTALELAPA